MTLGFHYHICFSIRGGAYYLPAHFGIFIRQLSVHVGSLILFLHQDNSEDEKIYDYKIERSNISIVKISDSLPAYTRYFKGDKLINGIKKYLITCDYLLLRGPGPMNHHFKKHYPLERITNLVVGDYKKGNEFIKQPFHRYYGVKALNYLMHTAYIKSLRHTKIAFNSEVLYKDYAYLGRKNIVVNTSNIYLKDIIWKEREALVSKAKLKLLYVGRIEWAKGLNDLLEALEILNKRHSQVTELHLVGWDETPNQFVLKSVIKKVDDLGLNQFFFFHGKKAPGEELYFYYRMADVFILPSYQEGFPRTIWEALANCLPVVVTPVGAIPSKLKDKNHALFCEVKNAQSICNKIDELVKDTQLHLDLVKNGFDLVQQNTIEIQTEKLIDFIQSE